MEEAQGVTQAQEQDEEEAPVEEMPVEEPQQQQEEQAMAPEAAPQQQQQPRPPAPAFRAPGTFSGVLGSPVLLPMLPVSGGSPALWGLGNMQLVLGGSVPLRRRSPSVPPLPHSLLQQVEPSPSTSMLSSYPMPLFHPGTRLPHYPSVDDGYFYPYAYPKNFIAPSRNRQVSTWACGALHPLSSCSQLEPSRGRGMANNFAGNPHCVPLCAGNRTRGTAVTWGQGKLMRCKQGVWGAGCPTPLPAPHACLLHQHCLCVALQLYQQDARRSGFLACAGGRARPGATGEYSQ